MKFNINDYVTVKLTPYGRGVYLDYWKHEEWAKERIKDGTLHEQMWYIMKIFGEHISMGLVSPIETTIEIEDRYLQQ